MRFSLASCLLATAAASAQNLPDVRLTFDVAFSATTFDNARTVAAEGPFVNALWFDMRDGNREIYTKRSTNDGLNWGPDTRLTVNSAISHFPSIAMSGGIVIVVWEEYRDGNG